MTSQSIFSPGFKTTPYWWEVLPPATGPVAPFPDTCDVAVVGGGYVGLAAAIELARSGASVTVLDEGALGAGASTRNGGAVGSGMKLPVELLARSFGDERARAMMAAAADSFAFLETFLAREGIDCRYYRSGRFVGAHSPRHYDKLARKGSLLRDADGSEFEMLPRNEQHREIGSDFYHGGIVLHRTGALDPALFHAGLASRAQRAGAVLCPRSQVWAIAPDGPGFLLATSRGTLKARHVLVATNGYTGRVTPSLMRRIVPIASQIVATEELPEELARSLAPRGRTLSDTKRILFYFRLSPDRRRLLFGGRASFRQIDAKQAAFRLHGFLKMVYPQLSDVKITHSWSGNVAFTFDHVPHVGMDGGVHYCLGCNGSGIAMGLYLGTYAAARILGRDVAVSPFETGRFPTMPLYGGSPWFLPVVGGYYRLRDYLDSAFG